MNLNAKRDNIKNEFFRLFFPLMQEMYNISSFLFRNRVKSEELVRDTYSRAYREFIRNPHKNRPRMWILRIFNESYGELDGYGRDRPHKFTQEEFLEPSADGEDIFAGTNGREIGDAVNSKKEVLFDTIHDIPPESRMAFLLSSIGGLNYNEIGEVMDLNRETVGDRIKKAKLILEKIFVQLFDKEAVDQINAV
jgi:RNA polymerase sigma factor (sigma-70 family)